MHGPMTSDYYAFMACKIIMVFSGRIGTYFENVMKHVNIYCLQN